MTIANGVLDASALSGLGAALNSGIYGRTPANLRLWQTALSKLRVNGYRPRVLFIGDSKDMGAGAGTSSPNTYTPGAAARNKTAWLAVELAARGIPVSRQSWFGSQGLGSTAIIAAYDPRRPAPTNWTIAEASIGGGLMRCVSPNTDVMSHQPEGIVDTVDVIYAQQGGLGSFEIRDGATVLGAAVNAGSPSTQAAIRITRALSTRGAGKTINIARSAGADVYIIAVIAYDSQTPAIELCNGGAFGTKSSDWVSSYTSWAALPAIGAYAPHLGVIQLGANDVNQAVPLATSRANLITLIQKVQLSGSCVLECFCPMISTWASDATQAAYRDMVKDLGAIYGCMVIDHGERFVSYANANAAGLLADGVHETALGYNDEAQSLANALIF